MARFYNGNPCEILKRKNMMDIPRAYVPRAELAKLTLAERKERKRLLQNAATARYQEKNRDALNAKARASRAADPERHREYMRAKRRADPPRHAAYIRKHQYKKKFDGLTIEEYEAKELVQGGKCGICATGEPGGRGRWAVDHCHKTGRVRMLLCQRCNTGIGFFRDDVDLIQRALDYLKKFITPAPCSPE